MDNKDYIFTQMKMIDLSNEISELDFDAFLKTINNAETLAPILDPTLFIKAQGNLSAIKDLAKKFQAVKEQFLKTQDTILRTVVAEFGFCPDCKSVLTQCTCNEM